MWILVCTASAPIGNAVTNKFDNTLRCTVDGLDFPVARRPTDKSDLCMGDLLFDIGTAFLSLFLSVSVFLPLLAAANPHRIVRSVFLFSFVIYYRSDWRLGMRRCGRRCCFCHCWGWLTESYGLTSIILSSNVFVAFLLFYFVVVPRSRWARVPILCRTFSSLISLEVTWDRVMRMQSNGAKDVNVCVVMKGLISRHNCFIEICYGPWVVRWLYDWRK